VSDACLLFCGGDGAYGRGMRTYGRQPANRAPPGPNQPKYQACRTTEDLFFSAEKRCGKTLLLEILELLVANPWLTRRATVAVLARKIDQENPTLLFDETDAAFKSGREYGEALRDILNTGLRAGGSHSICVGQGANIIYQDHWDRRTSRPGVQTHV